ncbi:MAG TPA: HDOD domain-containing protein [Nevskiaceae bacterium]|nr:HDOD domain-containing protein [Nevskiaceae bacterium]
MPPHSAAVAEVEKALLPRIESALAEGRLRLPTLPTVALKVRRVAADPNAGVDELAQAIASDVALTARLIAVANSAALSRGVPVQSLRQALVRLGLNHARDLVCAIAVEQSFNPRSLSLRTRLVDIWSHSKDVAAISAVLAAHFSRVSAESALLAGLLHEVGSLPLLAWLESEGEAMDLHPAEIEAVLDHLKGPVGARVLAAWAFPESLARVPLRAPRGGDSGEEPDLVDVVALACRCHELDCGRAIEGDSWRDFPPARRLGFQEPADYLGIGPQLRQRIRDTRQLLQ